MERSGIQGNNTDYPTPDSALLHPGYRLHLLIGWCSSAAEAVEKSRSAASRTRCKKTCRDT
jgi:hypothetical protein